MKICHTVRKISTLLPLTIGVLAATNSVQALEGVSPLQPGATTGNAAGALPPPGLYFGYDIDYEWGKLHGKGSNKGINIKARNSSMVASLVWSTPYKFLGARYAMGIAQPYKVADTKLTTPVGESNASTHGAMSTILMPLMLSWDLGGGFHLGAGTSVILNNGKHSSSCAGGVCSNNLDNLANHYYTIEPNLALTYFTGDWAFTVNNVIDFNFKNTTTEYKSGHVYYMDLTAAKRINKWTLGLIGNWTKQFTDDKKNDVVVQGLQSAGSRVEHVMFGPLVGYDFGKFAVTARFLASVHSENDPKMRFFHVGVAIPL